MRKISGCSRRSLGIHLSFLTHVLFLILFPHSSWDTLFCSFSVYAPLHPQSVSLPQNSLSLPLSVDSFWVHKLDVILSLHWTLDLLLGIHIWTLTHVLQPILNPSPIKDKVGASVTFSSLHWLVGCSEVEGPHILGGPEASDVAWSWVCHARKLSTVSWVS